MKRALKFRSEGRPRLFNGADATDIHPLKRLHASPAEAGGDQAFSDLAWLTRSAFGATAFASNSTRYAEAAR